MPWATNRKKIGRDGKPVHYFYEERTKADLPKAPMARIESNIPEPLEVQKRQKVTGLIQRIQITLGINAEDPEDRKVLENIEKTESSNRLVMIEGRYWLAKHHPEVLREIDRGE